MKIKNFNHKGFKFLLQSQQKDLLNYLSVQIPKLYKPEMCECTDDYIFAKGDIDIMLVCHLDTVHSSLPRDIFFDYTDGVMWSPQGIGGDDRCGVYSLIYIISKMGGKLPWLLFTTNEEFGGVGAKIAAKKLKDKISPIKYLIEFDRKGKNDSVYYSCNNEKFQKYIDKFGFVKSHGSYSDISSLMEDWGISGVNLSCGYYNAHTKEEYIVVDEMIDSADKAIKMLQDSLNIKKFKYVKKYTYANSPNIDYKSADLIDQSDDYGYDSVMSMAKEYGLTEEEVIRYGWGL